MPRRYLIIGLLVLLVGAAVVAGVWIPQRQGPDWRTLLEQKYGRKVVQLDRESFNRPHLGPDSSLVRAAWVEWEGGGTDLIGLPAHELGEPAEVVRRAELLPEAEWRLWCFQAFHPGEADPWQTSAAGFALHSGFVRSPHLGDTIVAHAGKVPVNQSFSTGPETPHCEFRFTPSGWTLRKVEVFRR